MDKQRQKESLRQRDKRDTNIQIETNRGRKRERQGQRQTTIETESEMKTKTDGQTNALKLIDKCFQRPVPSEGQIRPKHRTRWSTNHKPANRVS